MSPRKPRERPAASAALLVDHMAASKVRNASLAEAKRRELNPQLSARPWQRSRNVKWHQASARGVASLHRRPFLLVNIRRYFAEMKPGIFWKASRPSAVRWRRQNRGRADNHRRRAVASSCASPSGAASRAPRPACLHVAFKPGARYSGVAAELANGRQRHHAALIARPRTRAGSLPGWLLREAPI